ncbi:MAG TPA: T9SS type A sorting domain-containing protein, partial [Ignavibacteria bacterium]
FIAGHGTTNEPHSYSFEDKKLQVSSYKYRLKQIDYTGSYEYYELANNVVIEAPRAFTMGQNYPNPSNPKSKIDYEIPITGKVSIKLYDILGQEVYTIVNESKEAGYYTAEFNGTNLASGVYFYRIIVEGAAQNFSKTLKMILVK